MCNMLAASNYVLEYGYKKWIFIFGLIVDVPYRDQTSSIYIINALSHEFILLLGLACGRVYVINPR